MNVREGKLLDVTGTVRYEVIGKRTVPREAETLHQQAREAGGHSVGCNIELPKEQTPNPYLDRWVTFRHFYVRKVMLVKYSYAFIALPGGFGTLDEITETATLIQTGKIRNFPLVLMGVEFWKPLTDFIHGTLLKEATIDPADATKIVLSPSLGKLAVVAANLYVIFFNVSWGPVMWVMLGEMFPNQIRGSSLAVAGFFQWFANYLIAQTFPVMAAKLGLASSYTFYGVCAVISFFLVQKFVHETKGKELEQMQG